MAYVFLDESGDLGFNPKKKSSKYFVITFMFVENKNPVEKAVKKVARSLSKKELKKFVGELHACKEKPKTRIKMLSALNEKKISMYSPLKTKHDFSGILNPWSKQKLQPKKKPC